MRALLEVNHLKVHFHTPYGVAQAVRDVSFSLAAGETLAIVGESGCGKSVLCKSVIRLLPKQGRIAGGTVRFGGQDLTALPEKALHKIRGREIAMVFQDPMTSLNPTLTVGRQIMESVLLHERIEKKAAKKRTLELMEMVGIADAASRFDQYPHQFSGGMRQRSVLAAALAGNPRLLIADEPTTALDVTVQAQILDLIGRLQRETGISILFVTHDLGVVAAVAQRVAVMYAGKIVEIGAVEELFGDPRHPYTWSLLAALPTAESAGEFLPCLPGTPPDLLHPPRGDAFAPRNRYALEIDFIEEPPLFQVSDTHYAATWLLRQDAPQIRAPVVVRDGKVLLRDGGLADGS